MARVIVLLVALLEAGRAFQFHLILGSRASPRRVREADQILASLRARAAN